MSQLKMFYRCKETQYPENKGLFTYRKSTGSLDEMKVWVDICKNGLIKDEAGFEIYKSYLNDWKGYQTEDTFFVDMNGEAVATITAIVHPENKQGYVHMVAAKPECRGKGVAKILNQIACAKFWESGCVSAYLTTDDERVPAIKSYLSAGFLPVEYDEGMTERWEKILKEFGYSNVEMVDESGNTAKYLLSVK